jgi:hypothetical protein
MPKVRFRIRKRPFGQRFSIRQFRLRAANGKRRIERRSQLKRDIFERMAIAVGPELQGDRVTYLYALSGAARVDDLAWPHRPAYARRQSIQLSQNQRSMLSLAVRTNQGPLKVP